MREVVHLEVMHTVCCGIDVHKKKLVACIRRGRKEEVREYGATTKEIKEMVSWIKEHEVEIVAMESTGVYWKPLVNIFEMEDINFIIVNARSSRHLPGRKTDVQDAQWIAQLLQLGQLRGSYIPSREQRELRDVCRYRKKLVEERSRALNRLQKHLEGANIKLSSVVSEIGGVTSLNILDYMINNQEALIDEEKARELIITRISASVEDIVEAMDGIVTDVQRFLMKENIEHMKDLEIRITRLDELVHKIMTRVATEDEDEDVDTKTHTPEDKKDDEKSSLSYQEAIKLLIQIPGIGVRTAQNILAEIGLDMSRFPTSGHLASWASVCPGNNESAGKRKSGKTKKGNKMLKSTLVQAATSAVKNKSSFLNAQYQRIAVRRGKKRATTAVAHSILISIYHILNEGMEFVDLGSDYYNQFNPEKKANYHARKIEELGYMINMKKIA